MVCVCLWLSVFGLLARSLWEYTVAQSETKGLAHCVCVCGVWCVCGVVLVYVCVCCLSSPCSSALEISYIFSNIHSLNSQLDFSTPEPNEVPFVNDPL